MPERPKPPSPPPPPPPPPPKKKVDALLNRSLDQLEFYLPVNMLYYALQYIVHLTTVRYSI